FYLTGFPANLASEDVVEVCTDAAVTNLLPTSGAHAIIEATRNLSALPVRIMTKTELSRPRPLLAR
ncbi:hypothetical protein BaRGS_00015582, partial [Batillaria attramentaria]